MRTVICHPDNAAWARSKCAAPFVGNSYHGLPVMPDSYLPVWKYYPLPKWWRRWFLREKQRPPARVFFVVDLPPAGTWDTFSP